MDRNELIQWLMQGDKSIQYQVMRDLLETSEEELQEFQASLTEEGYIHDYLSMRDNETGMWGGGMYSPKWISTHYTLLELKNLCISPSNQAYGESAELLMESMWYNKGQVRKNRYQDLCVCGMIGSIVCYAKSQNPKLYELVDYVLDHVQEDGGFNCSWPRSHKSSIHTTLTMLIFINDYIKNGYSYRLNEIQQCIGPAREWLLERELFLRQSDGTYVLKNITDTPYPNRYKYDILKALDYFAESKASYDPRMQKALDIIVSKQLKTGAWPQSGNYTGKTFFDMKRDALGSRINTLRVLRVLKAFNK